MFETRRSIDHLKAMLLEPDLLLSEPQVTYRYDARLKFEIATETFIFKRNIKFDGIWLLKIIFRYISQVRQRNMLLRRIFPDFI
ncbi:uncharacterized protein TrAtP1_010763 [Trichoderma atroviride]|uniref:uncharacterized protein n=1 Tax=Hypocrea atroviridis TaxID=63577 RepID=UPI00331ECAFA|nr:hypothetical protein TrAtP1_010763 [Trichoderma atroviride]